MHSNYRFFFDESVGIAYFIDRMIIITKQTLTTPALAPNTPRQLAQHLGGRGVCAWGRVPRGAHACTHAPCYDRAWRRLMATVLATAAMSVLVGNVWPGNGSFVALCCCSFARCASSAMRPAARRMADMCAVCALRRINSSSTCSK